MQFQRSNKHSGVNAFLCLHATSDLVSVPLLLSKDAYRLFKTRVLHTGLLFLGQPCNFFRPQT